MLKHKDKQKLRESSNQELTQQLTKLQAELPKNRNELRRGKLNNLKESKKIRYQIAFIKTVIREKELINQLEK